MSSIDFLKRRTVFWLNRFFTGNTMDYKQIFAIILPIFVDNAFIVLMSLLNTAMISSSGVAAVSAVSIVDSLNLFIMNLFIALATGGTVIVAQYKGSGNGEMVSKSASQAVSIVVLVSIVICMFTLVFHMPILSLLFGGAEADVLDNARIFLIGSAATYPLFALFQAIVSVLRGVAETKASLMLSVVLNCTYFFLNIVFVTMLDMGVAGLVLSLIISRLLGTVVAYVYLMRFSLSVRFRWLDALRLNGSILKKIMYIGFPFALEQMFFNGGKLLTQTFIVKFGTLALTVNAISSSLSMVFQIAASALSVAIVTVVGICVGRGDMEDAKKFTRSFLWLSTVLFLFLTAILLPLFPYIVQLFSPPGEIIQPIFQLMIMLAIGQPLFWSLSFILPSALRAAGDSKFTSITAMLSMWLFRVVLGYLLAVTFGFGVFGVWLAMTIEWGIRGAVYWRRFQGTKWYAHKLI